MRVRKNQHLFLLVIILCVCASFPVFAQINLPPNPYFTSPQNDEFMSCLDPNIIKVYEKQVELRVVDLSDENDITHCLFDFSSDGITWAPIGEDNYSGFEGIQFNGDYGRGSTNSLGGTGWNLIWETETLDEGTYFLRAALFDQALQQGTTEQPLDNHQNLQGPPETLRRRFKIFTNIKSGISRNAWFVCCGLSVWLNLY